MYDLNIPTPETPPDQALPPHSIEAEQAVLGAILLSEEAFELVSESLNGNEFFLKKHELIFRSMCRVYDDDQPIDLVTLVSELADDLELVGGIEYITNLVSSTPTASNVMHYVKIVKDHATHRLALKQVQGLVVAASNSENGAELIEKMQMVTSTLADEVAPKKEFVFIRDVVIQVFEKVEQLSMSTNNSGVTGIESGYPDLDKMTAGFQDSDLIIVAARPSVGKTAFALNVAQNVAVRGKKTVAIFSLEMSASQLVQRMICAESSIDASRMKTGYLEGHDWEKMTMAIGSLSEANIYIDDSPAVTVTDIRSKCRRLKKEQALDMILIDYLQLISGSGRRGANRQEEVTHISRTLKQIARELEVPVIALSQLSRGVEQRQDKRPMLSDLRESGSIEQDADIVAFLYRDDYYNQDSEKKNIIEVILAKQRNGPVGKVELLFLKKFSRFANIEQSHLPPEEKKKNQKPIPDMYGGGRNNL